MVTGNSVLVSNITAGRNPRKYFDPVAMLELENSIRATGLLQRILLRFHGDGFQIVAGERRYRAFVNVFGPDSVIPCDCREMTDQEADAAALAENIEREDMTAVEEAEAAAKVLGNCKGDRIEAAKVMGWRPATLDKRLALMYATNSVREALQSKLINLGHAELLAVCRKETQEAALVHLLSVKKMTVVELKEFLEAQSLLLTKAIFDQSECLNCHHNSGNQAVLFAESISTGRCTNKFCFDAKTEGKITATADSLREEYQVVRIVRAGDNLTVIPLVDGGPKGVGVEQGKACRMCKDFGAIVSAVPDKLDRVFKDICMNVGCNTQLVSERIKAETTAKVALPAESTKEAVKTSLDNASANGAVAGSQIKPKTSAKGNDDAPGESKAGSSEPSKRLLEYREKLWREIYVNAIPKLDEEKNRMLLLALCLTRSHVLDTHALAAAAGEFVNVKSSTAPSALLKTMLTMEPRSVETAISLIAANVSSNSNGGMDVNDVQSILKTFDVQVTSYWKVCQDFFDLLTKNEIDAVCEEIGIKAAIGVDYAKLRNGPKEDYIKAVTTVANFDYRGRVPKVMCF